MNIEAFVASYGSALPAQELYLLQAAAAYYKYYYDNILTGDDFQKQEQGWRPELDITVSTADGGETSGSKGSYDVKLPSGNDGFKNTPVAGIAGWESSTFLMYDSEVGLVHEIGHVILGLLGELV